MKTKLLVCFALMNVCSVAQATEKSVTIAQCQFPGMMKNDPVQCNAEVVACLDEVKTQDCLDNLKVTCDGNKVFDGTWTPGVVQNPHTLVVTGDATPDHPTPPKIWITPGADHEHNASVLETSDSRLSGNCVLTFDSAAITKKFMPAGRP